MTAPSLGQHDVIAQESSTLDEYIELARATPTPTPAPVAGDPILDGLIWIYVRVPANRAIEMDDSGCSIRDDVLDQSVYEYDPFVIGDADRNVVYEDVFVGTSRIRWAQIPWEPGTSDRGWTALDGTRICRFQGRFSVPYSPTYQVVFGERARGPYEVTWESIVANDQHLILDVDLTKVGEPHFSANAAVFDCSSSSEPLTTVTGIMQIDDDSPYVDILTHVSPFGRIGVTIVPVEGKRTSIIGIPLTHDAGLRETSLFAEIETLPSGKVRFEIETPPFNLTCKFVVHGASSA